MFISCCQNDVINYSRSSPGVAGTYDTRRCPLWIVPYIIDESDWTSNSKNSFMCNTCFPHSLPCQTRHNNQPDELLFLWRHCSGSSSDIIREEKEITLYLCPELITSPSGSDYGAVYWKDEALLEKKRLIYEASIPSEDTGNRLRKEVSNSSPNHPESLMQ